MVLDSSPGVSDELLHSSRQTLSSQDMSEMEFKACSAESFDQCRSDDNSNWSKVRQAFLSPTSEYLDAGHVRPSSTESVEAQPYKKVKNDTSDRIFCETGSERMSIEADSCGNSMPPSPILKGSFPYEGRSSVVIVMNG